MKVLKFIGQFLARFFLNYLNQPEAVSTSLGENRIGRAKRDYFAGKINKSQYEKMVKDVYSDFL